MKKLLLILALATSLFACKKDNDVQPTNKPLIVSEYNYDSLSVSMDGVAYSRMAPVGWKIDAIYLEASSTSPDSVAIPSAQDYIIMDYGFNGPVLYDITLNTESMYNTWIEIPDEHRGISIFLPNMLGIWHQVKIKMSKI